MSKLLTILIATLALSACSAKITPPGVEIESGTVKVEVGDAEGKSKFCPPGQAKKGLC